MKSKIVKFVLLILLLFLPQISATNSSFFDLETSTGNTFAAGCWGAPALPTLLTPGLNSSDHNQTFTWSATTNHCPSPQTFYQFQIYTDSAGTILYNQSGQLTVTTYSLTSMPSGQYWWRVKVSDQYGYSNTTALRSLTIDDEPPTSSLDSLPPTSNQNPLSIGYSASDNNAVDHTDLCYSFNLNPWVCGNYFNFTFSLGEGTYYFDTIAHDLAGNSEKSVNHDPVYIATRPSVLFDTTPPTTNQVTPPNSFTGQNLLTDSWTHDTPVGDYHQVDEPDRGQVILLGNQSDTFSGTDSISQNLFLPQSFSGTFQFSYRYVSNDSADYDQFSVGIFHQDGIQLLENILTDGNNTGALNYDTGWLTLSHSLQNLASRLVKLVISVSDTGEAGAGLNSYALIDDVKISTLDLRLGETTAVTFDSVDTGSGIATTTPPEVINVGETTVTFSATDLATNIESTNSSAILTLPPVVLNKIDKVTNKVWLYNNSATAIDLTSFWLDFGTTQMLSGTIPASSTLGFDFVSVPVSATAKLYGSGAVLIDSTVYADLGPAFWQRQSDGLGPWVKISAPLDFDLQSRLSVGKITLTISGLATTLADMSYTIDYSDTAGPQQIYGQISPDVIDSLGTTSRDFFLGTCSSGTCINATGVGATFVVNFGGLNKTFTLN